MGMNRYVMVPLTGRAGRVNVDSGVGQVRQVMQKLVSDIMSNLVALLNRQCRGDGDIDISQ